VALLGPSGVSIAPHTPFIGPAGLATLHFLATMKQPAYYAVIEAAPHMDMYGDSGLTRWQPELNVPTAPGLGFDPDPAFLERAWADVADAARTARITVILGTERVTACGLQITACVINPDGIVAGWQDKGQIDPSEEVIYPVLATERRVFTAGPLTFGVVICHEGWRYPETVRWAVRRGAQVVFHPHAHVAEPGSYRPLTFADPANTFHEKAKLCRAAENTCYFASVNCASEGPGTTSAIARPDGTLQCYQPYGQEGLLVADLDLSTATGLLASRCRTSPM
jgi:predicted amidohydrolase